MVCLAILISTEVPWWVYLLLALGPDIGMLGYLINPSVGAVTYNVLHHKGVALGSIAVGFLLIPEGTIVGSADPAFPTMLAGVVLLGHSSMDRMLGFGLKYGDDFKHTHLGWIGEKKELKEEGSSSQQ